MTIYLFSIPQVQRFTIKQIHAFASDYLRSWLLFLPYCQVFASRTNRLGGAFMGLATYNFTHFTPEGCSSRISLLDSMPIITCSGKRQAKVALEIANKGYCATKSMYFHGIRLYMTAFSRPKRMPFLERMVFISAAENDLNVFKQVWDQVPNRIFIGDKIYDNKDYFTQWETQSNSVMPTPVKVIKNQPNAIKQRNKAADDLFSVAVSRIQQPIHSILNWIITKNDIQKASKSGRLTDY